MHSAQSTGQVYIVLDHWALFSKFPFGRGLFFQITACDSGLFLSTRRLFRGRKFVSAVHPREIDGNCQFLRPSVCIEREVLVFVIVFVVIIRFLLYLSETRRFEGVEFVALALDVNELKYATGFHMLLSRSSAGG